MKVKDIIAVIEETAPLSLQDSFDNGGLNVGLRDEEVSGVLVCVDVTDEVVEEAISMGCNMIVSHHPLLFHPLRQVGDGNYIERIVRRCVVENISLYAAHTALDRAVNGVSRKMADMLGLEDQKLLAPYNESEGTGYGIVGCLAQPENSNAFLEKVKTIFSCDVLRYSALNKKTIHKVAVSSGAGGSFIGNAMNAGADIFISADLRYNDFFSSENGIIVVDIGHFESEYCAIDLLYDVITKKISTFAVHKSESSANPVKYLK